MYTDDWKGNILYVSHRDNLSGAPISLMLLARKMRERGHHVCWAAPRPGPLSDRLISSKVECFFARGQGLGKHFFANNLAKFIRGANFDLVHVNTLRSLFGVRAAAKCNLPVIWHIREDVKDMGRYLKYRLASLAHMIVVPSAEMARHLEAGGIIPSYRLRVIANGVDVSEIQMISGRSGLEIRQQIGIPSGCLLVGMVGSVKPRKGVEYYIRAADIVCRKQRDVLFFVIGDPFPGKEIYFRRMKRLVRDLNIEDRLLFFRSRPDVLDIVKTMDIVVMPSLWEGMSRIILEAMALSRPVIATRVGGNPELIHHGLNGALVSPRSANELAEWIIMLGRDPRKRSRMGKRGREIADRHFSLQRHIRSVETLYRELIGRNIGCPH